MKKIAFVCVCLISVGCANRIDAIKKTSSTRSGQSEAISSGVFVPEDIALLEKRANSGNAAAAFKLHVYYGYVNINGQRREYWLRKAADLGSAIAQYNRGAGAWYRTIPTIQSMQEATYWLKLAASNPDVRNHDRLSQSIVSVLNEIKAEKHLYLAPPSNTHAVSNLENRANVAPGTQKISYSPEDKLRRKIKDIVIPEVQFTQIPLNKVAEILSKLSEKFDKSDEKSKGVLILMRLPGGPNSTRLVTIPLLPNFNLVDILNAVTAFTNTYWIIKDGCINIVPVK